MDNNHFRNMFSGEVIFLLYLGNRDSSMGSGILGTEEPRRPGFTWQPAAKDLLEQG